MKDDAAWYEAAFVVGVTNALNVAAEGLPALAAGVLSPVDETCTAEPVAALFAEIRAFYASAEVPAPFRLVALDPGYARDLWEAVQRAFAPNRLPRPLKEALAFAVSLTTRSSWGTQFHGAELKRLGISERGLLEVLGVTQMFSSYTKIADTLQLESDMGGIAPVDGTPAPG
jgi:AhpD family alkylhydroperoxidase